MTLSDTGRSGDNGAADETAAPEPAQDAHRCETCGGGRLVRETVKTALWSGDERLVVVEGVPALVCDTCGERFYEDETAMMIDMMRGDGFPGDAAQRTMSVPVFAYDARGRNGGKGGSE